MRNLVLLAICISTIYIIGCNNAADPAPYEMKRHSHEDEHQEQVIKPYYPITIETPYQYLDKTEVIEMDSCEWVSGYGGAGCSHDGGPILAHRGRCKFCAQRDQKALEVAVEKALRAILDSSKK